MKKSTILLAVALVFFLGCLMAFNFKLKELYESGVYKDRYRDYKTLDFTGFDAVEVNGGTKISVRLTQGPCQVRVHEKAHEYLQVSQQGNKLVLNVNEKNEDVKHWGEVLISLPKLKLLETSSNYTLAGEPQKVLFAKYQYNNVNLIGFTQDSLHIQQDHATQIDVRNNHLGKLTAIVGATPGSGSKLTLYPDNKIQAANLDIRNKSTLNLENLEIPAIQYQFSDSATANITGASLKLLAKE